MMTLTTNPQLDLAFRYVQQTNKNIFLTGKAGTGKTTFLHRVKAECVKRIVIVAPTGVAAINAKGMTIHSFFQLPFGPIVPGNQRDASRQRRFSKTKINLIKSLDLLVIDEISMVRSDVLDGIDEVLRRYKDFTQPFGGVQLLMIGDLHQLPPVVKPDEWQMLGQHYQTPYFFGSHALRKTDPVTIQLTHIFRQSDQVFINLLNKVRDNHLDAQVLEMLNSRYIANFEPTEEEAFITLTSHNASANSINQEKLRNLDGKLHKFQAIIDGNFPPHSYPTQELLEFKVGAQVLFVKNDISFDKKYYNGKIGQITAIEEDTISVRCPEDTELIHVSRDDWENVKYSLNERTKSVDEKVAGTFTQFPLKLAWAITIHKSQGLTFERAIIDANAAFAHGQVYVALSRCKSFEGIVLRSKIDYSSVKTDSVVRDYSTKAEQNAPDENHLQQARREFQQWLIQELFDFEPIKKIAQRVYNVFMENENTLSKPAFEQVKNWVLRAEKEVFSVGKKFQSQLYHKYFSTPELPEQNHDLQDRIQKASIYFYDKMNFGLSAEFKKIPVVSDNQKVLKLAMDNMHNLRKAFYVKIACLALAKVSFSAQKYIQTKADAEIDFEKKKKKKTPTSSFSTSVDSAHPLLYDRIKSWRDGRANELGIRPYEVLPVQSIVQLTKILPTTSKNLLEIKGIGKVKVQQFGEDLVDLIENYCIMKGIPANLMPIKPKKPKKPDTKKVSFDFYKQGKTIAEIATVRDLVESTIRGHLAYFVAEGELNITDFIDEPKVEEIRSFLAKNEEMPTSEVIGKFGGKVDYWELRMVKGLMKGNE